MNKWRESFFLYLAAFMLFPAHAEEVTEDQADAAQSVIELQTTSVKGSQELPKVLVIVPWKSSKVIESEDRPLASLVEEILTPLDPAVFRRQTNYYNSLQESDEEPVAEE